ncbi:MAG: WD40/YVTN/BNR-like repeat-containing protein [Halobacterium sp.]
MPGQPTFTRRGITKAIGAAAAGTAFAGAAGAASTDTVFDVVESPTASTLHDVEYTSAGAYAVGGGGVVLERGGEGWTKLLDGGPTGNGNDLYGADVTDDGKRLWFVGASGAIGEYDVEAGVLTDHSAPMDVTNNFNDVSVTGNADEANVYVAGDSGKMYYSYEDGATGSWDYTTPGSGAAIHAVDFFDDRKGHIVDGNTSVFYTRDGGTWDRLGVEDANHNFYGVDSDGFDDVWVSGAGGTVYRWNGSEWRRADTGDATLRDVEVESGDGFTVGGGGNVYERPDSEWEARSTPTGENLKAVVRGATTIAVGAGGTIIEG